MVTDDKDVMGLIRDETPKWQFVLQRNEDSVGVQVSLV